MAGRRRGPAFILKDQNPNNDESDDSTESPLPAWGRHRSRGPRRVLAAYGKPRAYTRQSGQLYPGSDEPFNHNGDEQEEEEEDDDDDDDDDQDYDQPRETNDNPLYELEDEESRSSPIKPAAARQGTHNNNPLYGNVFNSHATATRAVCMTQFLQPKRRRRLDPQQPNDRSDPEPESTPDRRSPSPPSAPQRKPRGGPGVGIGLFRGPPGSRKAMIRSPPVRFSPIIPGKRVTGLRGKRIKKSHPAATAGQPAAQAPAPRPLPRFDGPRILDLIAAVRSDQNLLIAEVRRDGSREPRIPGDHDRYFAPRKGDIIVHFSPTPENEKLVEYFDEKRTMPRLQTGDKLVRVKYDNYKIPDHLMITSKLYIYAPEWVYLGKAVQTIKTA